MNLKNVLISWNMIPEELSVSLIDQSVYLFDNTQKTNKSLKADYNSHFERYVSWRKKVPMWMKNVI